MADNPQRLVGLDFLRFFAASWVVMCHAHTFGRAGEMLEKVHGIGALLVYSLSANGSVAVDIFFVLSGFLVSGLLFKEAKATGTVSPLRFLIRRGFKIYPAFWVMTGCMVAWRLANHDYFKPGALWSELLYLQNYVEGLSFHAWSLAVEEHFYFFLAGVFWILKWRTRPGQALNFDFIPDLFLTVAVVCLLSRWALWAFLLDYTYENEHLYMQSDFALFDQLFFGVFLAHLWHNRWDEAMKQKIASWRGWFFAAGMLLLVPAVSPMMNSEWFRIFGFVIIYIGAGCLLLGGLGLKCDRGFFFIRWGANLGQYSYSVYLWHLLVGLCVFPLVQVNRDDLAGGFLNFTIYFALCWVVGIVLASAIEFPVLRLRDRRYPSLAGSRGIFGVR